MSPHPPSGLPGFARDLPGVLRRLDAQDAFVEEKGLAIAIHTRRLPQSRQVFDRLLPELSDLARRHELVVEPGKEVVEIRGAGMDKGQPVRRLAEGLHARGFLYAGDDLGDVEAFEALDALEAEGLATLRVAVDPAEDSALGASADLVAGGPEGVLELLERFAREARAHGS